MVEFDRSRGSIHFVETILMSEVNSLLVQVSENHANGLRECIKNMRPNYGSSVPRIARTSHNQVSSVAARYVDIIQAVDESFGQRLAEGIAQARRLEKYAAKLAAEFKMKQSGGNVKWVEKISATTVGISGG